MELSSAQRTLIAQAAPVLLIALIADRSWMHGHHDRQSRKLFNVADTSAIVGLAFSGIIGLVQAEAGVTSTTLTVAVAIGLGIPVTRLVSGIALGIRDAR